MSLTDHYNAMKLDDVPCIFVLQAKQLTMPKCSRMGKGRVLPAENFSVHLPFHLFHMPRELSLFVKIS